MKTSSSKSSSSSNSLLKPSAKMFSLLAKQYPKVTSELDYGNIYQLLVAVVLSAQSTDRGVNLATALLFAKIKTPQAMVELGVAQLCDQIKSIGLYRTKARNIIALSYQLIDEHASKVPATREQLMKLPGVGRKTANVVLNVAFGRPEIAVDTHVFRVANRTGLAAGKKPLEVEEKLISVIPKAHLLDAHLRLIMLGRYVCKARTPDCVACPWPKYCDYYQQKATTS